MYLRKIDNRRLDTQSLIYRKVYVESNYQNNNEETTCGVLRTHPSKPGVPATLCTQNSLKDEQRDSMTLTRGEGAAEEGVRLSWAEGRQGPAL